MITRTYRAAIRVGEDFITIEETVELPVDATDDQIAQAVNIGWRIYEMQREAVEKQVAMAREGRGQRSEYVPPSPLASDKQRNFIATLQDKIGWTSEQMAAYASEQGIDLATLTRSQASAFIDQLQGLARQATTEGGIIRWAEQLVTPAPSSEDIPF